MSWFRFTRLAFFAFLFFLATSTGSGSAAVFKCRDADGGIVYQDRRCLAESVVSAATPATPAAARSGHFFWQASNHGSTVYLLGSIHFGNASMYPLDAVITDAFAAAGVLVVEANVLAADAGSLLGPLKAAGFYPGGESLRADLDSETWAALERKAGDLGVDLQLLIRQKPWLAELTLVSAALRQHGYSETFGVDLHFIRKAGNSKEIIELESVGRQVELLAGFTLEEQIHSLRRTLEQLASGDKELDSLFKAWQEGDGERMDELLRKGFGDDGFAVKYRKSLFGDRNRAMADKIAQLAVAGRTLFVVVGAGHLVGKGSIVELLKEKGFAVNKL